jgi:hypothetical protein
MGGAIDVGVDHHRIPRPRDTETGGEAPASAVRCRSAIDNRLDQSGTAKGFGNLLRGKLALGSLCGGIWQIRCGELQRRAGITPPLVARSGLA